MTLFCVGGILIFPAAKTQAAFSDDGKQTTDFSGSGYEDYTKAVKIQPDGKIIVAGSASSGNDIILTRYLP